MVQARQEKWTLQSRETAELMPRAFLQAKVGQGWEGPWVGLGMDLGSFLPSPAWALRLTRRVAGKQHPPGPAWPTFKDAPLTSLGMLLPASLGPGPHFHEVASTQPETQDL